MTKWMDWTQLPWMTMPEAGGAVIQLADRLLHGVQQVQTPEQFAQAELPELATQFSAQWAGWLQRTPKWKIVAQCGRHQFAEFPWRYLEEILDREQSGHNRVGNADWSCIAIPLQEETGDNSVLMLAGRNLGLEMLPHAVAVGRAFGLSLSLMQDKARAGRRIERMKRILEIAMKLSQAKETQPLLELIATEATRLMNCDRSSIFLWDRDRRQVVACPALGVEGNTLRLPDNAGIVGEVIHSGHTLRVDDAYNDPRFNQKVDEESGYKTRNLLCCPLLDGGSKIIGAFEVINKNEGCFTEEDEETLLQLGIQVAVAVQSTQEREELVRRSEHLTKQVTSGVQIIGESPAIAALRDTIKRVAPYDLPVLIMGESGTGKEVVSQALHYQGPRSSKPFVAVNCAALTETLLESELFGHEKGAFTDAHEARQGKFELADGGTLFLDEMGEMSAGGQAKLLRVLEQKVITRVGGSQVIPVNVRVVAATNVNLAKAVAERRFREDLYYRLSVVPITLPALRDRPEDILPLAEFFLERFCMQAKRKKLHLSAEARRRIQAHSWPGNIRELRNLMERVAFLTQGEKVEVDDLAFILSPESSSSRHEMPLDYGLKEATHEFQRDYITRAIKRVKSNMSEAAKLLGLHRSNLYRKMRQLDMETDEDM